ncbi:MAG: hypothetical protein RLZZ186_1092 [Cyanobacteriota bacterium]|jgi:hypothetical protein
MAINANMNTSYALSNFEQVLAPVIDRAIAEMNKEKGGAAVLKRSIVEALQAGTFISKFQVRKPEPGRQMTIGELCESYKHETTLQVIDPSAVEKVLFGPDGLIRKAGGGRAPYLMEDIEVGFIKDPVAGQVIGPVITSGRNRTLALQVMLRAAGVADSGIEMLPIRVGVIEVGTAEELQRRIISANTGSRDFSRAETRERTSASGGLMLLDRDHIQRTIALAKDEAAFKAAMGAWIKDAALSNGLNSLTPAQYADTGVAIWNGLVKTNRPEGKTFYSWIKADTLRFVQIARVAEEALPMAVTSATGNKSAGPLASKLAKVLLPVIANRCSLNA